MEILKKIDEIIRNASGLLDLIVKIGQYFLFEHNYNKEVPEQEKKDKVVNIITNES